MNVISIVIVTFGRASLLDRALQSFARSAQLAHETTNLDFELIALINGEDSASGDVLESFDRLPKKILSLSAPLKPSEARNSALMHARGDWIYFADDDVVAPERLFSDFHSSRSAHPDIQVIGGPNLSPSDSNALQLASGLALASPFASFKCADRYRRVEKAVDCDDSKLILCNLFVRSHLPKQAPFPQYICAEENHVLARWKQLGAKFMYEPSLAVDHIRRPKWISFFAQIYKYGRGRGRLIRDGDFSWYHLVPLVCLSVAVISLAIEPLFDFVALVCFVYVSAIGFEAIRLGFSKVNSGHLAHQLIPRIAVSIVLIHVAYALGVAHGMVFDPHNR